MFCDIIILIELQGEMFRIYRVFVAFVFCAFCVGGVYAANTNSGPTRTVNASGIETGYSGAQSGGGMNDKLCVGKKNGDSCSDNTKTGTCQIQKNNGKMGIICLITRMQQAGQRVPKEFVGMKVFVNLDMN